MKKTLLIGLAAVALGSMTACSNILEEEGTISASAKTGSLVVALEADGGVDVTTKAGESVAIPDDLLDNMKVKATLSGSSPEQIVELTGEIQSDKYVYTHTDKIKSGAYKVTATYDKTDGEVLCWDSPIFYGETNVTVKTGDTPTEGSITATLQNSQIVLDETSYDTFDDKATIDELYVHEGITPPSDGNKKFSLLPAETKTLYVKNDVSDLYLHIKGTLTSGSHAFEKSIKIGDANFETESAKKYKLKCAWSEGQGSMKITITIDGNISEVELPEVNVDPYAPQN